MLCYSSSLVPVFTFGENNIYDQAENPEGSFLKRLQVGISVNKHSFSNKCPVHKLLQVGNTLNKHSFSNLNALPCFQ